MSSFRSCALSRYQRGLDLFHCRRPLRMDFGFMVLFRHALIVEHQQDAQVILNDDRNLHWWLG
jgi:hypothetical protein